MTGYMHEDGTLILARWGHLMTGLHDGHGINVPLYPRTKVMYGTKATGEDLVSNGQLGVDLIRLPAGGGFAPHTHPGDHLLIVVAGHGTISYQGRIYPTEAGQVYMVEGSEPHAVSAVTDHCILAVGSPHRPLESADRMTLTEYAAVAADLGRLTCLICHETGTPDELAAVGCSHAPAKPPAGKIVVVGIASASKAHEDRRPFSGTASGDRLAHLFGVASSEHLVDVVDTVNLFPRAVADWQAITADEWNRAATDMHPVIAGRVVLACGNGVAGALGADLRTGAVTVLATGGYAPALVVTIPHPAGAPRSWTDPAHIDDVRTALATVRTLAAVGPPTGHWTIKDAAALEAVTITRFPRD